MRLRRSATLRSVALTVVACVVIAARGFADHDRAPQPGQAVLQDFPSGCSVEMDSITLGKTDAHGVLALSEVEAGDHYLHVDCAGQSEQEFFISLKPGQRAVLQPKPPAPPPDPVNAAQARDHLRDLVQQAADARTAGHSDEAIADLRHAVELDPANADLHRELGITFLLLKDWNRARVEYLEAIKHDPGEAESHNGLGYALEKLGDIDAAAKEYATATHLDPDDGEYREHYFKALAMLEAEKDKAKKK